MGGNFLVLILQLLPFEGGQAAQLQIQNGVGLLFGEAKVEHQLLAGIFGIGRASNRFNYRIQLLDGLQQPLQNVLPLLRLGQIKLRAANNHLHPVFDEDLQGAFERQQAGLVVD